MKPIRLLILMSVSLFSNSVNAIDCEHELSRYVDVLEPIVKSHNKNVEIKMNDRRWVAGWNYQYFTVHRRRPTGEYLPETDELLGPNFTGFLINVSIVDGAYQGAARIPQTLNDTYWDAWINRPAVPDCNAHYVFNVLYGDQTDPAFIKAVIDELSIMTINDQ